MHILSKILFLRCINLFVFGLIVVYPSNGVTQSTPLDSLHHVLENNPDKLKKLEACYDLAGHYMIKGNSKAIKIAKQAITIATEVGDTNEIAMALNMLGVCYREQTYYEEAMKAYIRALKIVEQLHDSGGIAAINGNIGDLFYEQEKFEKAAKYFQRSAAIHRQIHHLKPLAQDIGNLANTYSELKQLDTALILYQEALRLVDSFEDSKQRAYIYHNMGAAYKELGNYDRAIRLIRKGFMADSQASTNEQSIAWIAIAEVFIKLDQMDSADYYLKKAYKLSKNSGDTRIHLDACFALYEFNQHRNNNSKALEYFQQYNLLKDSLDQINVTNKVTLIESKYFLEKQENELSQQQLEIDQLQHEEELNTLTIKGLIVLIIMLLLIAGLIINYLRAKRKTTAIKKELIELELVVKKKEAKQLKAELAFKNQSLTSYSVLLAQKNELMQEVISRLKTQNTENTEINQLIRFLNSGQSFENEWKHFNLLFEEVHQGFFGRLKENYPDLTPNESRLCAFLKLNLNSKQIASLLNIASRSVDMNRHRIRKKMKLETEDSLTEFIQSY